MQLTNINNFSQNVNSFQDSKKTDEKGNQKAYELEGSVGMEGDSKNVSASEDSKIKEELKDRAREMLPQERKLGAFEDKDWIGEAKDFQIGPDIRFAVKSKNPEFLKRIVWGPLTAAEFREVTHRIRELDAKQMESNNILRGKIINPEKTYKAERENQDTQESDIQQKVDLTA